MIFVEEQGLYIHCIHGIHGGENQRKIESGCSQIKQVLLFVVGLVIVGDP